MAIIPRANPANISRIDGLPSARNAVQVSSAPAEAMGRAVQGLGELANKIYQQKVEENNAAALMDARRQYQEWDDEQFNPENQNGIARYQGRDALQAERDLIPASRQRLAEIGASLPPGVRQRWNEIAFQADAAFGDRVRRIAYQRHDQWQQFTRKSAEDALSNSAALAVGTGDDAIYGPKLAEAVAVHEQNLRLQLGQGADVGEASRQYQSTIIRSGIEQALARQDIPTAQALLDRHRATMNAQDVAEVTRAMMPWQNAQDVQSQMDALLSGVVPGGAATQVQFSGTPARTEAEAREMGRASFNARTRGLEGTARNPTSSAVGVGQMLEGTWAGLLAQYRPDLMGGMSAQQMMALPKSDPRRKAVMDLRVTNPQLAEEMATHYAEDSAVYLFQRGLPVTPETIYLAHHFGPAGAVPVIQASPDTPIRNVITPQAYDANSYLHGKTVGQVLANHARRAGETGPQTAQESGQRRLAAPQTLSQAETMIRDIYRGNPLMRERMLTEARSRFAARDQARRDQMEAITLKINRSAPGADLTTFLTVGEQAALRDAGVFERYQNNQRDRVVASMTQDDPHYVADNNEAILRDPVAWARNFDPNSIENQRLLSQASRTRFADLRDKIRNEQTQSAAIQDYASESEALNTLIYAPLGIAEGQAGSGNPARSNQNAQARLAFANRWYQTKQDWARQHPGEKMSDEQRDKVLRSLAAEFAMNGMRGADQRNDGVSAGTAFGADVPEADRRRIIALGFQRGVLLNDADVRRIYASGQRDGVQQ